MKKHSLTGACIAGAIALGATSAMAQSMDHSQFEIEPHLAFGYAWRGGGGVGLGAGLRVGIPLVSNGPISNLNNSLALSAGAGFVYFKGEHDNSFTNATAVTVPVMLQWNFYLTPLFSIFPEAGVAGVVGGCGSCGFTVWPSAAVGGRIHFNRDYRFPSFTFRLSFPSGITLGVSF